MLNRKIQAIALVLFAWTMIGADNCDPYAGTAWDQKNRGSGSTPPPRFCTTDPPLMCAGVCSFPDLTGTPMEGMPPPPPSPTVGCDAATGDLGQQFVDDIYMILVCNETLYNKQAYVVFPPSFYITPKIVEPVSDGCALPPTLPDTMPLSTFWNNNGP